MTPKMYCEHHSITATEFARRIGVSKQQGCRLVAGTHRTTAERALDIERLTENEVTRHDLRPDLFGPPPAGTVASPATAPQDGEGPA